MINKLASMCCSSHNTARRHISPCISSPRSLSIAYSLVFNGYSRAAYIVFFNGWAAYSVLFNGWAAYIVLFNGYSRAAYSVLLAGSLEQKGYWIYIYSKAYKRTQHIDSRASPKRRKLYQSTILSLLHAEQAWSSRRFNIQRRYTASPFTHHTLSHAVSTQPSMPTISVFTQYWRHTVLHDQVNSSMQQNQGFTSVADCNTQRNLYAGNNSTQVENHTVTQRNLHAGNNLSFHTAGTPFTMAVTLLGKKKGLGFMQSLNASICSLSTQWWDIS